MRVEMLRSLYYPKKVYIWSTEGADFTLRKFTKGQKPEILSCLQDKISGLVTPTHEEIVVSS